MIESYALEKGKLKFSFKCPMKKIAAPSHDNDPSNQKYVDMRHNELNN